MGRRLLWIACATILIAAATALIFLIRAGDPSGSNWPIHFELRSSDNGVLFQFAQDVFRGRAFDWSFSPQVFVFPEIPISLVAYLVAGGAVQMYFLIVAAINNALLFVGLFAVVLVALGIWVAASPGSVPGLTQPSDAPMMQMGMQP